MLIEVRRAMAEDISRVLKFYTERRYRSGIRPEDALLLAEHDGELIGLVRLTTGEGGCCPGAGWQRLLLSSVSMAESDST